MNWGPVSKKVHRSQADSNEQSRAAGLVHIPLPSIRRWSAASLRMLDPAASSGRALGASVVGLDGLGHPEVLVGDGAVRDAGIGHGHPHRPVAEEGGDRLQAHAPVDGLGGQGVAELVGVDVSDARPLGHRRHIAVDGPAVEGLAVVRGPRVVPNGSGPGCVR